MRSIIVRQCILRGAAVLACLLASQAAMAVTAISSTEYVRASAGGVLLSDKLFDWRVFGPNLSSFQASGGDSGVWQGVSVGAFASQDLSLAIDAPAGTITGVFAGTASGSVAPGSLGMPEFEGYSSMDLVFSVPEGQGMYRLHGALQQTGGHEAILLRNWHSYITGDGGPGNVTLALVNTAGAFDLSGVLPSGDYVLTANVLAIGEAGSQTVMDAANLTLDFSIVPEPATVLLMLLSLAGGSIVRRKR
jgi:hypothetical protein